MHPILEKVKISQDAYLLKIQASHVSRAEAGQFVMVQYKELSEPIPLSILSTFEDGFSTLVKVVGRSTLELVEEAQELFYVAGPLGKAFPIEVYGKVAFYSHSWGIAPLIPIAKALKDKGNYLTLCHTSEDFYLEEEAREIFHEVLQDKPRPVEANLVVCAGSNQLAKSLVNLYPNTPIISMVNVHMLDAVGLCLVCRVLVDGELMLACSDGPWFPAHKVDWDNLISREEAYKEQERVALEEYKKILRRKELRSQA